MWLGERRGNLVDWSTQRWVQATGRRIDLAKVPSLAGPVGETRGIGLDYFDKWAAADGLVVTRHSSGKGLLPDFSALAGDDFDPSKVDREIVDFYERSSDYDIDVWSEWSGLFRPFGFLVAAIFSRRLEQLNLPLSSLDTSLGMSSEVVQVRDAGTGELRANAWIRTLLKTGRPLYVGSYSISEPPGGGSACVKTVFPLPNGNAMVFLRPEVGPDGSLVLVSEGRRFGDAGFYFTIRRDDGSVIARYLRSFRERIHVYAADDGDLRTDHAMTLWRRRCIHLHYRLRKKRGETARSPSRAASAATAPD